MSEDRIRGAILEEGDLEALKAVLDDGGGITRGDGYALIREVIVLRARLDEAHKFRNALIRQLGKRGIVRSTSEETS